jgi:predicted metal-dependent hydrolase
MRNLLMQDGRAGRITRRSFRRARAAMFRGKTGRFARDLRKQLLRYFRPGFHPPQQDDRPTLERMRPVVEQRPALQG